MKIFAGYRKWFVVAGLFISTVVWAHYRRLSTDRVDLESLVKQATSSKATSSTTDQLISTSAERVRQRPEDDNAWAALGQAFMQKARDTMDVSYYSRADKVFQKALSIEAKNVSAITGMAWVTSARHEFEQSIKWANKALSLDSGDPAAYGLLGDAAVEMGDYEAAYEHYQKMLDVRPDLSSYSRGAHILYLSGDTKKATWLMKKAIDAGGPHAENTAWCRAQFALMLWNTGILEAAEQVLSDALERTPNNIHVLMAMGKVKGSLGDYAAAIDFYKKAVAVAPQLEAVIALGDLYRLTGQPQDADKQFSLVEQIHQLNKANGVRGDLQIARFYADHDRQLSEATEIAEQEYRSRPNVFAADTLAWCLYKTGRYAEARKAVTKALSHQTPDANILFHAGMIYSRLGDRPTAQKFLYQALSLNPTFDPVHFPIAVETLKELGSQSAS